MKKLLIAVSAAACALGAFADDTGALDSSTGFETQPEGALNPNADDEGNAIGEESGTKYWWTTDATGVEATVTAYGEGAKPADANRPAEFFGATNNKYLNIESTSKPLYRTVDALNYASTGIGQGQQGIYIDTMVQFTAGDPTMSADDAAAKLAIWVCGNTEDGDPATETNFVVRATQFVKEGETVRAVATNYTMTATGVTFTPGEWYRLTVKTIAGAATIPNGAPYAGFVVFVNKTMLTPVTDNRGLGNVTVANVDSRFEDGLMPSLQPTVSSIAAVGFSGTGAIDDISFTTTAPEFADDAQNYLVDIGEGVTLNLGDTTLEDDNVYAAGADLEFTATAASGFLVWYTNDVEVARNAGTWTGTLAKDDVLKVVALTQNCLVGDVPYASLADAFAKADNDSTIKLTGAVTLEGILEIDDGETFTLDLNGQTLTGGDEAVIDNSGSLTIVDSSADQTGRVVPAAGADNWAVTATYGTLTIYAGAYEGDIVSNGGSVVINGGKFLNVNEYDVETWSGSYTIGTDLTVALVDGYFVVGAEAEPTVITITFENGETSTAVEAGEDGKVTAPADPTKTGYTFAGWFAEGATTATDFATTVFTADTTLTAQWTANEYTVTFYTNGVEYASVEYTYAGNDYEAPLDPVIDGFTFDGWFADQAFETAFEFSANVADNTQVAYAKLTAVPAGPSIAPGGQTDATYDSEAAANAAAANATVAKPEGCGDITAEAYNAYFKMTAVQVGDKWAIKVELADAVKTDVDAQLSAASTAVLAATEAGNLTVTESKKGLWYTIYQGSELNALTPTSVLGTGDTITLPFNKPAGKGFYRFAIDATDQTPAAE